MAIPVLIIGKSGSGKSASLRNFKEEDVDIINVIGKPLPFKNNFKTFNSDNYDKIRKAIDKSQKDIMVIDDAGYLLTNEFMRKHSQFSSGNAVYTMYNNLADNFWSLIEYIKNNKNEKKIVYIIMHEEKDEDGDLRPKTVGKLLDNTVCIEGLFTIVLRCASEKNRHFFLTQTDGRDVVKTPIGMFSETEIDNDLKIVDETIRQFYNMEG